jgi:hypothetical protein
MPGDDVILTVELRGRHLDRWVIAVRAGWGPRAASTVEAMRSTLLASSTAPELRDFGCAFAEAHHTLEETLDCLRLLGSVAPRSIRRSLERRGSLVQVTIGWADATLERDQFSAQLVPLDMLRLRLRQHFQLADELGADPAAHSILLVIESPGHVANAELQTIVRHTRTEFFGGETIAVSPAGTIVALVERTPQLIAATARLSSSLRADPTLTHLDLRVWLEPLGHSVESMESHLVGLAG